MARNHPMPSTEDYRRIKSFHGMSSSDTRRGPGEQPRTKTPIYVPPDGSTSAPPRASASAKPFSSHSHAQNRKRSSPHPHAGVPRLNAVFKDNLRDSGMNSVSPQTILGTARRSSHRSSNNRQPPSPGSSTYPPLLGSSGDVYVDVPGPAGKHDKGKGKALLLSPPNTRSRSLGKASMLEPIHVDSDDDDIVEFTHKTPPGNEIVRRMEAASTSSALQAKERRRKKETASSKAASSSAADPGQFYARNGQRSDLQTKHQRRLGPIRLEEPDDRKRSRSGEIVLVGASPEPDIEIESSHRINRNSTSQTKPKLVDRMNRKNPSPNASAVVQQSSSSAAAAKTSASPGLSPTRSPRARSSQELASVEQAGSSRATKRMRTDARSSSSVIKHVSDEKLDLPFEVPVKAIVISDVWRSRDSDRTVALIHANSIQCGVNGKGSVKIKYNDIRGVMANKPEVQDCGILCLTLTPKSESARNMQDKFPEFDPCASGDAAQVQLIAHDSSTDDLASYNRALAWITSKLRESSSDRMDMRALDVEGVKSKIRIVDSVKRSAWPDAATTPLQQSQPRAKRVLIVPGDGRQPNNDMRPLTTYSSPAPRKKTFNLQPASPNSSANLGIDDSMPDAFATSKSPTLPALTIPRAKPASVPTPKEVIRRPRALSDGGTILHYPYEGTGAMSLRETDFDKLLDGGLLNDIVIEFGLKFILAEIRARDPELADSIYVFSTFFFPILMSDSVDVSYAKLRRWTAKEDLFSKKYIVVPVNENYHWYLALIVNPSFILTEQHKDNTSEQDKDEVIAALTLSPKDSARGFAALKQGADKESQVARHEHPQDVQTATGSEPGTPPLPSSNLPLRSTEDRCASPPVPMDIDSDPRTDTSLKAKVDPPNLDQAFIITLDSLGQRHVKLSNRLFEYLWREAWDKRIPAAAAPVPTQQPVEDTTKQPKTEGSAETASGFKEASEPELAKSASDASEVESKEPSKDSDQVKQSQDTGKIKGVRSVQVQDTRRSAAGAASKITAAEAWAKTLSKPDYINAQVPEQPNFCDCGIYLLHYFDRFFRAPEKLLKLMVEVRSQVKDTNKSGSLSNRQQVKRDIANMVKAEWQEEEVRSKRAYWRSKVVELSEGWADHLKIKEENEGKKEGKESVASSGEEEPAMEGALQQEQSQQAQDEKVADAPMPDVEQAGNVSQTSNHSVGRMGDAGENGQPSVEEAGKELVMPNGSLDDIKRSVQDYVSGKDPIGTESVDDTIALALSHRNGPLSLEHLGEPQREDREQEQDASQNSATERLSSLNFLAPPVGDASPSSDTTDVGASIALPAMEQPGAKRASRTLSSASTISHRPEDRRDQEQAPLATPTPFGTSFIRPHAPSSWPERQPPLSFTSSNELARSHDAGQSPTTDGNNSSDREVHRVDDSSSSSDSSIEEDET